MPPIRIVVSRDKPRQAVTRATHVRNGSMLSKNARVTLAAAGHFQSTPNNRHMAGAPTRRDDKSNRFARRANHSRSQKPVQCLCKKYFAFSETRISRSVRTVPPLRGAARERHGRGVGCGGRKGGARRATPKRTAKSCGPDAPTLASRSRSLLASDGGKKARSPGRSRISRKNHCVGNAGCFRCLRCEYSCAYSNTKAHTRLRVHRAPGIPCALCFSRDMLAASLGRNRAARSPRHVLLACLSSPCLKLFENE